MINHVVYIKLTMENQISTLALLHPCYGRSAEQTPRARTRNGRLRNECHSYKLTGWTFHGLMNFNTVNYNSLLIFELYFERREPKNKAELQETKTVVAMCPNLPALHRSTSLNA